MKITSGYKWKQPSSSSQVVIYELIHFDYTKKWLIFNRFLIDIINLYFFSKLFLGPMSLFVC